MRRDGDAHQACREGRTRFTEAIFDDCRLKLAAWTRYALAPDSANDVVAHEFEIYDGEVPASLASTVLATYAAILARNSMPDSARTVLTRALRTNSSSSYTLKAAAGAYVLLGQTDSALVMIRKLLAVEPDQRRALSSSAELRHLESDPQFVRLIQPAD